MPLGFDQNFEGIQMARPMSLVNLNNNTTRTGYVGFSWTVLFFGFIPPLFRQDIFGFLIILFISLMTFGLGSIIFAFFYNRWHYNRLIEQGYTPANNNMAALL